MMADAPRKTSRRDALIVLGGLAAVAGGWQVWLRRPRPLAFVPIDGLPGWKMAETGVISGGATDAVFIGLDHDASTTPEPLPVERLSAVLFPEGVDLAVFTDVLCPYCRRIVPSFAEAFGDKVAWHALPLLGRVSEVAARAAVAAEMQGGGADMHVRLLTLPIRPSPQWFATLADDIGLDGERLARDMNGRKVAEKLATSRAAAELLGLIGTPALVVPGTVISGAIDLRTATRIVERARARNT